MNEAARSFALDVMWLLARARVPGGLERVAAPDEIVQAVARDPFRRLFEDEEDEPIEFPVLASRAGAVFTARPQPLLDGLRAALEAPIEQDPLWLEPPHMRVIGTARLRSLRASPALRSEYQRAVERAVELVGALYAESGARLDAACRRCRQGLEEGAPLEQLLPPEHGAFHGRFRIPVTHAWARGEVVLTPVRLASDGGHVIGLPGYRISLGVPLPEVRPGRAQARAAVAESSRSLAMLGDATRLLILTALIRWPRTAEELQVMLSLPRSSISEHLTALRELGLVTRGSRQRPELHRADAGALRAYLARVADEIAEAAQAPVFGEDPAE